MAERMSFFARGYLGKGVMKGALSDDTAEIYFPTENEYFRGRLFELTGDNCALGIPFENMFLTLFRKMPSEIETGLEDFFINIQSDTGKKKKFRLVSKTCGHFIDLEYIYADNRFILNEIDFSIEPKTDDDKLFRFSAKRRTNRINIKIPDKKFNLDIPPDAFQINL